MKQKNILFLGIAAGVALAGMLHVMLAQPLGPNLLRNSGFEEGLLHWGWHVHRSHGARAEFITEKGRGANGCAAKLSITQPALHDSVEFRQSHIPVETEHKYTVSFRARSSIRQPLRVQILNSGPSWTSTGFRVSTEITPLWQNYRLTSRVMAGTDDGKLMFQCGGVAGDIWIDEVKLQENRRRFWN